MARYYLCEGDDQGLKKVHPFNDAISALNAAEKSKSKVHFISTINPFEDERRG